MRAIAKKLEYRQMSKPERERIFLEDGSATLGEAHEARRKYLEQVLREKSQRYFELLKTENELLEIEIIKAKQEMKRAARNYEAHLNLSSEGELSPAQIERAREREIKDFIEVKKGFALCPFHQERTPSLKADKNLWYCFGCGIGGDIISFIIRRENLSFPLAVKFLQ